MDTKIVFFILFTLTVVCFKSHAQNIYGLTDGRDKDHRCDECEEIIQNKPKEILFGIHFINGNVYFSMTNETWFNKIFTQPSDGITVDIVAKDQFDCKKDPLRENKFPKGVFLKPVLLPELKKNLKKEYDGAIMIKLGAIPIELSGKEIEGNLVIVRNRMICYYTNFTNIERSLWNLLDMGLYTDSLVNREEIQNDSTSEPKYFSYTKKITVVVPFGRGKSDFLAEDIKPLYDSLNLAAYSVKKIVVRSFSSVEGAYEVNVKLQQQRAQNITKAIQNFQKKKIRTEILSAENWVEFMQDVSRSPQKELATLSKFEIKKKLTDKALLSELEPLLSKHRKAVITIFANEKNTADDIPDKDMISSFQKAITQKDLDKAILIQRSIFERVRDNNLPAPYFDNLEIPTEKAFSRLLNDREIYKYFLNEIYEDEAIENLKELEKLDPDNGKIKYNICALQIVLWQFNDSLVDKAKLLSQIKGLSKYGIREGLVKRMLVNYNIILAEIHLKNENYEAKDKVLFEIKENYMDKSFTDRDLLSLGKYFSEYAQYEWADEIIAPRMNKLDVDEDLLFFYVNLCIFTQKDFTEDTYFNMLLNAININNTRFCRFFNSIDKGGISMQLLLDAFWKKIYCENCRGLNSL
jgi:hypothetical protein